ncbi:hypothetical protein J6590_013486 [Homalodisca vitripennis]|nr:hypothetical protein J6590_013486 [Homalodisca vitripennis]
MSEFLTDEQLYYELDKALAIPVDSEDDLDKSDDSDDECNPTCTLNNEHVDLGYVPEEPSDDLLYCIATSEPPICKDIDVDLPTSSTTSTNNLTSENEPTPSTPQQQQVTRKRGRRFIDNHTPSQNTPPLFKEK